MEQRTENNLVEVEPKKSGRGQYERKARGSYKNFEERKITVKHYINTKIRWKSDNVIARSYKKGDEDYEKYFVSPLYVQISFLKKTIYRRSNTNFAFYSELEYQNYIEKAKYSIEHKLNNSDINSLNELASSPYKLYLIQREKNFIEYYILKKYKDLSKYYSDDSEKLFYAISDNFEYKDFSISKKIQIALKKEILDVANSIIIENIQSAKGRNFLIDSDYFEYGFHLAVHFLPIALIFNENISAIEILKFYETKDSRFHKLHEKFSSEIWYFNIYYLQFMNKEFNNHPTIDYTILDFEDGTFQTNFLCYLRMGDNAEMLNAILQDIGILINNGSYDYEVTNNHYLKIYQGNDFYHLGLNAFKENFKTDFLQVD